MNYDQFLLDVAECIRFKVDGEYDVRLNHVVKNNAVEVDGIVLFKDEEHVSPNIYISPYYVRYQKGESVECIANDILKAYQHSMSESKEEYEDFEFTFDAMKDKIIYRLINYHKNRNLLEEIPHIRFLDLAITFLCLVKQDEAGIGTIRICNEHMEQWGVTTKDLLQQAVHNTRKYFPVQIRPMYEVLTDMLRKDVGEMCENEDGVLEELMNGVEAQEDMTPMYIMSNTDGINGASTIIYQDAIKKFAYEMNCDFYILPSSIHEVILIPLNQNIDKDSLVKMVNEVNTTQVQEEEVLSNKVYTYHRKTNVIEI